jgi:type VI protein secretion system component Hcp
MHAVQFMSTASPILHAFPFQNKQFTVYKFSIFYKHANPNNQPYYYITFTQYTKNFFDWHEGEITPIVYMIV